MKELAKMPRFTSEERMVRFARRRAELDELNKNTPPLKDGPITLPDPPNLMGSKRVPPERW